MTDVSLEKNLQARVAELEKERDAYAKALSDSNSAFLEKVKEFSIIKRIGELVRWNLDEERICSETVNVIIEETTAENCSLWLVDKGRLHVDLKAARGQNEDKARYYPPGGPSATSLLLGEGVAGWVAANGESMLVEDTTQNSLFQQFESKLNVSIKSLLCLPIFGENQVIGVMNLSHPDLGVFSRENERVLTLITNQAALAFENLFLFEKFHNLNEKLENVVEERTTELRDSEAKYRSFMEHAGDAIIIIEKETGKIVEANSLASEYTGYYKDELIGGSISLFGDEKFEQELLQASSEKVHSITGYALNRKSGLMNIYVDISSNAISTYSGEFIHLIMRDITQRRQLEAQLKEYSERLEILVDKRTKELKTAQGELLLASKLAAVGELASGVAHEINNPLAVISGYAEDLLDEFHKDGFPESKDREKIKTGLRTITDQADRCQDITRSLLDFTRAQELNVTSVDVNQVALQAIQFSSHKPGDKEISFQTALDGDLPIIYSDFAMIEQVLINLLSNSMDAIEQKEVDDGRITITTNSDSLYVQVTVEDNGGGMDAEIIEKIFNPFFTTKPVGKGTGLGLPICHKLMERLQGRLTVTSEPGKGSEFIVSIPKAIT